MKPPKWCILCLKLPYLSCLLTWQFHSGPAPGNNFPFLLVLLDTRKIGNCDMHAEVQISLAFAMHSIPCKVPYSIPISAAPEVEKEDYYLPEKGLWKMLPAALNTKKQMVFLSMYINSASLLNPDFPAYRSVAVY